MATAVRVAQFAFSSSELVVWLPEIGCGNVASLKFGVMSLMTISDFSKTYTAFT